MRRSRIVVTCLALVVAFTGYGLAGSDSPEPDGKWIGEVIGLREQMRVENQGQTTEIQIRDQNRRELWLKLGPTEQYGDAVQVGDRVRVQVMQRGEGEPAQIKAMQNYRSGERIRVCDGSGAMVQTRLQLRDGTGTGVQNRYRGQAGPSGSGQQGSQGGGGGGNGGGGSGRGGR